MNFFKSVFADDPDHPTSTDHDSSPSSNPAQPLQPTTSVDDNDDVAPQSVSYQTTPSLRWSFGGLVKTLQVKSDWIETYRRDLKEFGSGLRKETQVLREVATKAVKNLPSSLEIGASKAQVSLESVGQAIDSIGFAVADIISHGKESLLAPQYDSSDGYDANNSKVQSVSSYSGRYSRFDTQLLAIQRDINTYLEDPGDVSDYNSWLSEFNLEEKSEEIKNLMRDNRSIDDNYKRVVPSNVDHAVFWSRYFYRIHRLKLAESMRAKLVKRAISNEDEEELSWDVDDDDVEVKRVDGLDPKEKKNVDVESADNESSNKETIPGENSRFKDGDNDDVVLNKTKVKVEVGDCSKDSDVSVVSTQPSTEDDDVGWDEIEDISSDDGEKKVTLRNPIREELRKRLSAADEYEDLSWDIEDDE